MFSNTLSDFGALKTELESWNTEWVVFNLLPLNPQLVEVFGANQSFSVLLRPDNYIAYVSSAPDRVKIYFKELITP
ncbi:hypothetical protein H6F89_04565 [Cyanobacteria bacterium FACHB-63]|nr:hypothetical protein [Cyanobacteria bacterium FACHB-63]